MDVPTLVFSAVMAGDGAFLGSYLKKKAENLATHEDIEKPLRQVTAVTQTTKEIEAKISDRLWDRQKQWEIKRDIFFEAFRGIGRVEAAVLTSSSFINTERTRGPQVASDPSWITRKNEVIATYNTKSFAFLGSLRLAMLVAQPAVAIKFAHVSSLLSSLGTRVINGGSAVDLDKEVLAIETEVQALISCIRDEIGFPPFTPQPSESQSS